MKIFSGPLGAVWGPFVMVFIEGDKQTMGPRSTTYKMLTSGAVGRGFEKLRFWGGGGGGGTPKFTILTPPQKPQKKLWGPQFWRFLSNFDNFDDFWGFSVRGVKSWNRSVVKIYMYMYTPKHTTFPHYRLLVMHVEHRSTTISGIAKICPPLPVDLTEWGFNHFFKKT